MKSASTSSGRGSSTAGCFGKHRHKLARAEDFLQRRGGSAVFLGRFTAFFRAMMPALAGAAGMPYRTFLLWNALGGIIWGTLFVTIGHVAGTSYKAVEEKVGRGLAFGVVGVVIVAAIAWKIYEVRKDRREEREYAAEPADGGVRPPTRRGRFRACSALRRSWL